MVQNPNDQRMRERGWLDLVTGLPNQAMMQSHLRETLGTFADLEIPFAVVWLEIHEFSTFRARYGQEGATSMLQVLARTLRNTVWPTDFVGRWCETQFLVILCGCGEDSLQAVVERMRRMMCRRQHRLVGRGIDVENIDRTRQRHCGRQRGIDYAASKGKPGWKPSGSRGSCGRQRIAQKRA